MAKHGIGGLVKTRLYLEGRLVENALVSVMTHGTVNQPATAQLELVPTNTIRHILPFTWVHVFVTDPWDPSPANDLSDFKLLFEGVVMSRGFTRSDMGRNFVIQCADPSIFWTNAKQFWMSLSSTNGTIIDQMAIQTSGGYGRFGKITSNGKFGYMLSKLAFTRKEQEQAEERFLDTMIAVLDDIGNVNPFYTNVRNRFRITDRILRGPAGKTEKLFQLALLSDFVEGLAGRSSGQSNLAEVVNELLSAIFHEWVSVLAPPYIKTRIFDRDVFGNIKRTKHKVKSRGPRGRSKVDLYDFRVAEDDIVASIIFKPDVYTIAPPSCNVLFPNMYDNMSFTEGFMAEPTRVSMRPQLPVFNSRVNLTQGLLLQRPTELEVFSALIHDSKRSTSKKRTPDGKYADGESQTPTFNDYDWTTNEERVRGIVYNFMNLAPAPSTLTLSDPGKKHAAGGRKGGIPPYLQNVASYEFYKSKYAARQTAVQGPFNMRVVPGFPILILDDSDANLNVIAQLMGVTHNIDANGSATTSYEVALPRIVDELDYNRPKFKGGFASNDELDLSLVRDEDGNYDFAKAFDGSHQPPIPEWFDESFRNVIDLDIRYQEWFGAHVVQNVLFPRKSEEPSESAKDTVKEILFPSPTFGSSAELTKPAPDLGGISTVGNLLSTAPGDENIVEEILEEDENYTLVDAVKLINDRYRKARDSGREFVEAATFTTRKFTKIDEAFRFVGAAPTEVADQESANTGRPTFDKNPAESRKIDYKTARLDQFIGDPSKGSGYSAKPIGDGGSGSRMSGAFPVFDTKPHTGKEATDQKTRDALIQGEEGAESSYARYDGRPVMYDFEFRLWQQSLADAGFAPTGERIAENADVSDYTVINKRGGVVRAKTAEERAAALQRRREVLEKRSAREKKRKKRGRADPRRTRTMKPREQAPTGDGLEQGEKLPLPQPLSEKQVVDLRRSIIDAYRKELAKTRGFSG